MGSRISRAWRRRRRGGRDTGLTMVAVLASFTIMMTVLLGGAAYLASSTKYSRYDQDNDLALAAAQSGLSDLLGRLRSDSDYLTNVDPTDPNGYCGLGATGGPEGDYFAIACGWDASTKVEWQEFGQAVGGEYRQRFHYVVTDYEDSSRSAEVVSTGRAGDVVRAVSARITQDSTALYLYITDYEIADPKDYSVYGPNLEAVRGGVAYPLTETCGAGWPADATRAALGYRWEWAAAWAADPTVNVAPPPVTQLDARLAWLAAITAPPSRVWYVWNYVSSFYCAQSRFGDGNELKGRVHSNDTIISVGGAKFIGPFTSANPLCAQVVPGEPDTYKRCVEGNNSGAPPPTGYWNGGGEWPAEAPAYADVLDIPKVPDKAAIAKENSRCEYEGATRIIFNGPTMTVWSKHTAVQHDPACGSVAALGSPGGATVNVPKVIYTKTVDDPAPLGLDKRIPHGDIDGVLPLGTYESTDDDPPAAAGDTYTIEVSMDQPEKFAGAGNLWVEGEVEGRTTIFTDESIIVTGDVITADKDRDMLGLMATGSVEIYNPELMTYTAEADAGTGTLKWALPPYDSTANEYGLGTFDATTQPWPSDYNGDGYDVTIHAGILAGNGSFRVQSSNHTQAETTGRDLNVYGSIGQNFHGVEGRKGYVGGTAQIVAGYVVNYEYNQALMKRQPPLFPYISNGKWWIPWSEKVEPHEATKLPIVN
ncbi:MAG: hypothetical protein LBK59_12485 [Bifidobacteriaceae bacterium]|nr:hypothetical protein [Bifidobacteriaceae bacterium]